MSCCGQKRAQASTRGAAGAALRAFSGGASPRFGPSGTVAGITLRYAGSGPFTMRGPRSGRLYACSTAGSTVFVDPDDVDALLRTRLFTRAL